MVDHCTVYVLVWYRRWLLSAGESLVVSVREGFTGLSLFLPALAPTHCATRASYRTRHPTQSLSSRSESKWGPSELERSALMILAVFWNAST